VAGVTVAILAIAAPAAAGPYSNISAAMVRNAAPAVEAYRVDHGTYVGTTAAKLRHYDHNVSSIEIASARKDTYCIEASVLGSWYHLARTGPKPTALIGAATRCPRR
jgi:hypothetical protein